MSDMEGLIEGQVEGFLEPLARMPLVGEGWSASPCIDKIAPAWVKALGALADVAAGRTADAGQYAYAYASLGDATGMIRATLAEHGLAVFQPVARREGQVVVSTTVMHESGQWISADPLAMPAGTGPQAAGSAITYARRYALMAFCGLATEDDDGAVAEKASQARSQQAASSGRQSGGNRSKAQSARPAPPRGSSAPTGASEAASHVATIVAEYGKSVSAALAVAHRLDESVRTVADITPDMAKAIAEVWQQEREAAA